MLCVKAAILLTNPSFNGYNAKFKSDRLWLDMVRLSLEIVKYVPCDLQGLLELLGVGWASQIPPSVSKWASWSVPCQFPTHPCLRCTAGRIDCVPAPHTIQQYHKYASWLRTHIWGHVVIIHHINNIQFDGHLGYSYSSLYSCQILSPICLLHTLVACSRCRVRV